MSVIDSTLSGRRSPRWLLPLSAAAGCAALYVRTNSYGSMIVTTLVGVAGALAPVARGRACSRARWVGVVALGAGAFVVARLAGAPMGIRLTRLGIFSIILAAIAEEAFFRRFMFGIVARFGDAASVFVTAIVFALIHVPIYGAGALPVDLAAGLLLGWQRSASGGWSAPAVTHVLANLLQMG